MLEVHSSLAAYICKKLADPAWAHLRCAGGWFSVWRVWHTVVRRRSFAVALSAAVAAATFLLTACCLPAHRRPPQRCRCSFELSDSTVKGEGELKILSRLLHPNDPATPMGGFGASSCSSSSSGGQQEGETHLVLGADSDLLLMALVAGQVRAGCGWEAHTASSVCVRPCAVG